MLTAAAAWGYGTHLMRRRLTGMPIIALTFWMLVLTLGVLIGAVTILPHGYRETALRAIRGAQTIEFEKRGPVPARAAP
jgi:hypothetical protein